MISLLFFINIYLCLVLLLLLEHLKYQYRYLNLNKNLTKLEGEISDTHCLILALNNPRALSLVSNGRS